MKRWMGCKQKHIWIERTNRFKAFSITCTLNLKVSIKSNWHHHDVELPIELKVMPNWCRFCYFLSLLLTPNSMVLFTAAITVFSHTVCLSESTTFVFFKQNWKTLMQFCMEYHSLNAKSIVSMGAICMTLPPQMYVCVDVCLCCSFLCVRSQTYMSNNLCVWWIYVNWNVGRFGWL